MGQTIYFKHMLDNAVGPLAPVTLVHCSLILTHYSMKFSDCPIILHGIPHDDYFVSLVHKQYDP